MKLFNLITLLMLVSCAITPIHNETPKREKEIILSEEDIEKQRILEHYRLMRARQWDKINTKKVFYRMPPPKKVTPTAPVPLKIKYVDSKEQEVEIEQNIVFFCMNRKKFQRFENEDDCLEFTKNIQNDCLEEFENGDARLTSCVKSRLKY